MPAPVPKRKECCFRHLIPSSSPPSSVCDLNDYRLKKRGLFRAILIMAVLSSQSRKRWRSWLYWEAQGKSGRLLLTPAPAAAWLLWCCLLPAAACWPAGLSPLRGCHTTSSLSAVCHLKLCFQNRFHLHRLPTPCSSMPHSSFSVCSHLARPWFALCPLLCCYWGINFHLTILPF